MSNWIDNYKKCIISSNKHQIIVTDDDNLFQYEELYEGIKNEGYTIFKAASYLDVRFLYELNLRPNKEKAMIIAPVSYHPLPDLLAQVNFQQIGLKHLFPNLDPKAIKGLSFNALATLSNIKHYDVLGYDKTLKFLLENLYTIDFDSLKSSRAKERIINALITVFLERDGANEALVGFLSRLAEPYFPELVQNGLSKEKLIAYLQAQWESFITLEQAAIDFEEPILNRHFGYLFVYTYLQPIQVSDETYNSLSKSLKVGAYVDIIQSAEHELENLLVYLDDQQSTIEDLYDQWFTLIAMLAKAKIISFSTVSEDLKRRFMELEIKINQRFQRFISNSYQSLFSLSGVRRPVVVSRILDFMKAQSSKKKALLVIDGMNFWQWLQLSDRLQETGITVNEQASLAFIPTITAWSRQAIFKGEKPDLTKNNSQEGDLFTAYWTNNGYNKYEIAYVKIGVNEMFDQSLLTESISIIGLVCNDLDDLMHGAILGNQQLFDSTNAWITHSKIIDTISCLKKAGYKIYITSDHGSIEATGEKNLKQKDKVGSISRSKRHIHFSNITMLESFKSEIPVLDYGRRDLSLYFKNYEAFAIENTRVITHGGSHFWEVIVPFIEIK